MIKTLYFLLLLSMYVICSTPPQEVKTNINQWAKLFKLSKDEIKETKNEL
jgi:hypothetical protein